MTTEYCKSGDVGPGTEDQNRKLCDFKRIPKIQNADIGYYSLEEGAKIVR
jgi:hypothetical protein